MARGETPRQDVISGEEERELSQLAVEAYVFFTRW